MSDATAGCHAILGAPRPRASRIITAVILVTCLVCPLIELFDAQPIAGAGARQMQFSLDFDNAKEDIRPVPPRLLELFQGQGSKAEVLSELIWASLHGIAELSRTKRFPPSRQKERVRTLVELFTFPR